MTADIDPLSPEARRKIALIEGKEARGERVTWSDLAGICEPNPALPDCQSYDGHSEEKCELPNHHEGKHRVVIEW
jgi:hypothetical protein